MHDNKNESECQTIEFSVYVLWCSKTNMHYVGVTRQRVTTRIRQHKRGKQFVDREIQRIGWEHWDWWIVESHVPSNLISEREQYWVNFFGSVYPAGYNKTCGGISKLTVSDDTREKIRQNALARDMSGERNPHYGKKHTDDAKETIRQARLRRTPWNKGMKGITHHTAEHKAKIGAAVSGEKNGFFGKHHTEEAKEKNRQAHLGKPSPRKGIPMSESTKAKLRAKALERDVRGEKNPFYGKHQTAEAIEKSRQANLGRTPWNKGITLSEEAKAQIRAKRAAKRAAKEAQETP